MRRLWRGLEQGGAFPQCPIQGLTASPVGYSPYIDCAKGRMVTEDRGVAVCRDGAKDIAARARPAPYFVDVTSPDGYRTRLWFTRADR